jgi:WD40 repeat protein
VHDLAFHPREAVLATAAADGTVRTWSLDSYAEIASFDCGLEPVRSVAFDAKGERLVAAGDDARVRIFALDGARLLRELGGAGRPLWDARFVDGDRHLVTLAWNGASECEADFWDLTAEHPTARLLGRHSAWGRMEIVTSVDGSRFALSRVSDEPLVVLDARSGAELLALRGHLGLNFGILGFLGAHGERLATYDDHGLLVTFDATRGHELAAELDALPRARSGRRCRRALSRARRRRLRGDTEVSPSCGRRLELALDAGRDRASVLGSSRLALTSPADEQELAHDQRDERLAASNPSLDGMRVQALTLCRQWNGKPRASELSRRSEHRLPGSPTGKESSPSPSSRWETPPRRALMREA